MFICNRSDDTKCNTPRIVGLVLLGVIGAGVLVSGVSFAVKGLWNWLMPEIFGLKRINYRQALGLTILAKLFFGSGPAHTHNNKPKAKVFKKEVIKKDDEYEPS